MTIVITIQNVSSTSIGPNIGKTFQMLESIIGFVLPLIIFQCFDNSYNDTSYSNTSYNYSKQQ